MAVDPMQAWLLPLTAGWRASEAWWGALGQVAGGAEGEREAPPFATPTDIVLELPTMRLRRFAPATVHGTRRGGQAPRPPVLVVGPYALHHASIVDLAPGHSIVERLMAEGLHDVWVTEWRSATPAMAALSIDAYLADLLVAVEELRSPAALVGICQGGWLSLAFAARFPGRVRSLVLAGAPVDFDAAPSFLVEAARATPPDVMEALVAAGGGRALSQHLIASWGVGPLDDDSMRAILECPGTPGPDLARTLQSWNGWAVDLPGRYFVEVYDRLFRRNELAEGSFLALGRAANLHDVHVPLCLLVGTRDAIAPPGQALAAGRLVGTGRSHVSILEADCDHLPLFLGSKTLAGHWTRIAHWLSSGTMPSG